MASVFLCLCVGIISLSVYFEYIAELFHSTYLSCDERREYALERIPPVYPNSTLISADDPAESSGRMTDSVTSRYESGDSFEDVWAFYHRQNRCPSLMEGSEEIICMGELNEENQVDYRIEITKQGTGTAYELSVIWFCDELD